MANISLTDDEKTVLQEIYTHQGVYEEPKHNSRKEKSTDNKGLSVTEHILRTIFASKDAAGYSQPKKNLKFVDDLSSSLTDKGFIS